MPTQTTNTERREKTFLIPGFIIIIVIIFCEHLSRIEYLFMAGQNTQFYINIYMNVCL